MKIYCASGWFSEAQMEQLVRLENLLESYSFLDVFSPRKHFVCPPDADASTQKSTFDGNVSHIKSCDASLVNTSFRDIGSLVEFGMLAILNKPIILFVEGLPKNALVNLMLAQAATKVCTSMEQLKEYLDMVEANGGELILEPYAGLIE